MAEETPGSPSKRNRTPLPLRDGCGVCGSHEPNLFPCADCGVMFYCSQEHESQDRPKHESACKKIASAQRDCEELELELKQSPQNDFVTHIGRFWQHRDTHEYLLRRYELVEALAAVDTRKSVELRLQHLLEMLHLSRQDDLGLRFRVPYLFLRLNRVQDCYDFVWWWGVTSNSFAVNWRDPKQPFMDKKGAEPLEKSEFLTAYYAEYGLALPTLLLKIKLRSDLQTLQSIRLGFGGRMIRELEEMILRHSCETDVIANNMKIIHADFDYWRQLEVNLNSQIADLADWVYEVQPTMWISLHRMCNENIPVDGSTNVIHGNVFELLHFIGISREAWEEDSQALDELRLFSKIGQ